MNHRHLLLTCGCSALVPCAEARPKSAEAWQCLASVKQNPSAKKDSLHESSSDSADGLTQAPFLTWIINKKAGSTGRTENANCRGEYFITLSLFWPANRAAMEAMDQLFGPRPALFVTLMFILKPAGFRELLPNLWVTHPICNRYPPSWLAIVQHAFDAASFDYKAVFWLSLQWQRFFVLAETYSAFPALSVVLNG